MVSMQDKDMNGNTVTTHAELLKNTDTFVNGIYEVEHVPVTSITRKQRREVMRKQFKKRKLW